MRLLQDPKVARDTFFDAIMNYALRDGFVSGTRVEARLQEDLFAEVDGERRRVAALRTTPSQEDGFATESLWERPEDWVYFRQTPQTIQQEREFFESTKLREIAEQLRASRARRTAQ